MRTPLRPARALLSLAGAMLALTGAATPASAALPVTFDSLAPNTTLTNQYASDGITFLDPPGTSGLSVVKDVGSKANSGTKVAEPTCAGCEFEDRYMLIQLSNLADTASVRIGIDSSTATNTGPIRLEALSSSLVVLGQTTATLGATNFKTLMSVTAGGGIAFLRIRGTNGGGWTFGVDDVTYTASPTTNPDFSVVPESSLLVRQGGSATMPLSILRFNGSSGNINLLPLLPLTGISATFAPNPVGGSTTATSTMTVHAANDAAIGTTTDVAGITAVPAIASAGLADRVTRYTLTVEKSFDVSTPAASSTASVVACTPTTGSLFVTRARSGFAGTVTLAADAPDGYAVTLDQTTIPATGDGTGSTTVGYTIRATRPDPPATGDVVMHATSPGLNDQSVTIPISANGGAIDSFTPTAGSIPRNMASGTPVEITGRGFCPGSTVEFGNTRAGATPSSISADGTSMTVTVPRLAATGPLTVASGGRRIASTDPFTVTSTRSIEGFKFVNYTHPGVDLAAITELYGATQTQISIDPCNPFPGVIPPICPIPIGIPNPLSAVYIGISNAALGGGASCFGIGVTSQQLVGGLASIGDYRPAGAHVPWELNAFSSPDPQLANHIRIWHSSQLSSSWLGYWIDNAAANVSNGGRGSRTTIENELRAGRHPLVSLRFGNKGHIVVAYNLRPGPGAQDYDVDVYDPNLPVNQAELADPNARADREDRSTIHVRSGNWDFPGDFRTTWRGGSDQMVIAPLSVLGRQPVMPTDPFGVVTLLVPLASGGSSVSQVEDSSGKKLLGADGGLNPDAAARPAKGTITPTLTGDDSHPLYALSASEKSKLTLTGNAVGTGGASVMSPGFGAEVSGLKTAEGSVDALDVSSKTGSLGIDSALGGNIDATLARELKSGDQLGATVEIAGGDKGGHDLKLEGAGKGLSYDNGGTGSAKIKATLSFVGNNNGTPGEVKLPAFSVPSGGRFQALPASWEELGTVSAAVKDRRGRVIKLVTIKPSPVQRVSVEKLAVKATKDGTRQASVRVRFRAVPKGSTVQVAVNALQGKKIVATQTQTIPVGKAKGTKSYMFIIELPKGKSTVYGSATVQAGMSTSVDQAKKTVNIA